MVWAMLAVLAAGLVGYALGGWLGVAVGACSATAVTVLLDPLTPRGDRETTHEQRMRRNRRYRARYESLEDAWRHPYQPRKRTWTPADRPAQATATVEAPVVVEPPATVELPAALEAPAATAAPETAPSTPRKRASRSATPRVTKLATPRATKPATPRATKPAKPRDVSAPQRPMGRSRKTAPPPRRTSGRSSDD